MIIKWTKAIQALLNGDILCREEKKQLKNYLFRFNMKKIINNNLIGPSRERIEAILTVMRRD